METENIQKNLFLHFRKNAKLNLNKTKNKKKHFCVLEKCEIKILKKMLGKSKKKTFLPLLLKKDIEYFPENAMCLGMFPTSSMMWAR